MAGEVKSSAQRQGSPSFSGRRRLESVLAVMRAVYVKQKVSTTSSYGHKAVTTAPEIYCQYVRSAMTESTETLNGPSVKGG